MKHNEIVKRLTSEDPDIVPQSLRMIDQLLNQESKRGESAQARINSLLALTGTATALSLFLVKFVLETNQVSLGVAMNFSGGAGILFLVKAIYNLTKGLKPTRAYLLTPEIIFEFQTMPSQEALRLELGWKIWQYLKTQPVNTEKLFRLNRGQINIIFSFIMFVILGGLLLIEKSKPFYAPETLQYIFGIVLLLAALCGDSIMDRFGIFKMKKSATAREDNKG
jgi:hypothetical protein